MRLADTSTARLSLALTLVLALAAVAPLPAATQDVPAQPARTEAELRQLLAGAWYLAVSEAVGQQRIDRAIERAVGDMTYLLQGLARDQMRANTPLNRRIDIGFAGADQITVNFDQRFAYTTRPGVPQDFTLPDGSGITVRQYFRDGHLEQYFEASLGRRWSVYQLSPDGQTLSVGATQQGAMMPTPMHFEMEYRKR